MLATYMHVADAVAPAQPHEMLTLTLASLHVSKPDSERIRALGWPLPYEIGEHSTKLVLPTTGTQDGKLDEFLARLCMLGYSRYIADLVRWVCREGFECLQLDDFCEPSDRLPVFVG